MIFAPLIEWLSTVIFANVLPWLARNCFVIILGFVMQWLGMKIASSHFGATILGSLGNVPIPSALGSGFLSGGNVAGAYAMMNQFFPLSECFSMFVAYCVLLVACMVYRRTFVLAKTGAAMSAPK